MIHDPAVAIRVDGLSKAYRIWKDPASRLKYPLMKLVAGGLPSFLRPAYLRSPMSETSPYYRDFYALRNLNFEVRKGEAIGIIGRNGSGKSTLLQAIAGTLSPTSGSVYTSGRIAALLELGSGFNPEFTGRENVFLYGSILGLQEREMEVIFDDIASFADIGDFMDQPIKTYSSGMSLRLAFAVIVHIRADILIIDEALAVGDVFFVQKCMRWIRKFREEGTLLFVTHNATEVNALCDRAIWLKDGVVEQIGVAKEVTSNYIAHYHEAAAGAPAKGVAKALASAVSEAGDLEQDHGQGRGQARPKWAVDQRLPWLNATQFRNDITPQCFDPDKDSYGAGSARIVEVVFADADSGAVISNIVGGEKVSLRIVAEALEDLDQPILGFYLKDRLGQYLFGDNTYLSNLDKQIFVPRGGRIAAEFVFYMPLLPKGRYVVSPAIATGSQEQHVQQHWIHEALVIESMNSISHMGLVAIPMWDVKTELITQ